MDVKAHPWFKDFDWQAFESQTMPAPYIPKVALSLLESYHIIISEPAFDAYFANCCGCHKLVTAVQACKY